VDHKQQQRQFKAIYAQQKLDWKISKTLLLHGNGTANL
jgi:hypothetical protein